MDISDEIIVFFELWLTVDFVDDSDGLLLKNDRILDVLIARCSCHDSKAQVSLGVVSYDGSLFIC